MGSQIAPMCLVFQRGLATREFYICLMVQRNMLTTIICFVRRCSRPSLRVYVRTAVKLVSLVPLRLDCSVCVCEIVLWLLLVGYLLTGHVCASALDALLIPRRVSSRGWVQA